MGKADVGEATDDSFERTSQTSVHHQSVNLTARTREPTEQARFLILRWGFSLARSQAHSRNTVPFGDANLDGEFNSSDFVQVFSAGKYELDERASWNEGDWNGDEKFGSGDFVAAFQDGGYELGRRVGVAAVPEPSCWILFSLGLLGIQRIRNERRNQTINR